MWKSSEVTLGLLVIRPTGLYNNGTSSSLSPPTLYLGYIFTVESIHSLSNTTFNSVVVSIVSTNDSQTIGTQKSSHSLSKSTVFAIHMVLLKGLKFIILLVKLTHGNCRCIHWEYMHKRKTKTFKIDTVEVFESN